MAEDAVAAKRRRRCNGGGDMSALPEHVLHEVLSRVGTVKDLFMLATTCRHWLARFTDRTFLGELLCPRHGQGQGHGQGQNLLGFFLQDASQRATTTQLASACSFLPAPGSPLGPGPTARALTSSLVADAAAADDDGAFDDHAVPLAARRGIVLLMQRVPRRRDGATHTHLLLGVCNPVTGERHLLAPLRTNPTDIYGYAIITSADAAGADAHAGRFTFSQLLVATVDPSRFGNAVRLHSYSAAARNWSAPPTQFLGSGGGFNPVVGQRSAVVHQGAAHWLWVKNNTGDDDGRSLYKLSVHLGGGGGGRRRRRRAAAGRICFTFTRISVRVGGSQQLLCVTGDGELAVVCVYIAHVSVWTCRRQRQAGGGHAEEAEAWERAAAFRIPAAVPYPGTPALWQPMEKWFALSRGSLLVVCRSSAVFVVDLDRKTMEKVMDCFLPGLFADKMNRTAVPYEIDLVDFFMLKLGVLSSAGPSS